MSPTSPSASPAGATARPAAPALGDGAPEARPRQCGRCRLTFEGDPALHPTAVPDWWLCPPCRDALLGGPRRAGHEGGGRA